MVLDIIKNAHLYANISENLGKGLKYLQETDLNALEIGKYEIDGKKVYAVVSEYNSKLEENWKWEGHRNYTDIQVIISGAENMSYSHIANCERKGEYNPEKDVEFYNAEGSTVTVNAGSFAIFFPEDIHRPGMAINNVSAPIKKVVIKVAV